MKEKQLIIRGLTPKIKHAIGMLRWIAVGCTVCCLPLTSEAIDPPSVSGYTAIQQQSIRGVVKDETGVPISGVTIGIKGTQTQTSTDAGGIFSLQGVTADAILVFSYVGMETQEITVGNQINLDVVLTPTAIGLEEAVAIGYGTVQRRELTGSVTHVTPKDFNKGVTQDATDLLRGRVAGLTITQSSGDITSEQTLRIRGTTSLTGSSEPFVVIDGVPGMSLNAVAPQDIESISVMKDASAAAIYGSRSGSGVILITTKKGTAGRTTIDYNTYIAKDYVSNKPDVLSAQEWRDYTSAHDMNTEGLDLGANTEWFGELLRAGTSHNHDLSLAGGTQSSNYRASLSYLDRQGVVIGNDMQRINARMNFSQKALEDRLTIGVTGAMTQRDYSPSFNNFDLAYNMLPVYPVYQSDGSWFDLLETGLGNPVRNITYNRQLHKNSLYYLNARADLQLLDGLTFGISGLKERETDDFGLYYHSETGSGRDQQGYAKRDNWTRDKKLLETTLSYNGSFDDHELTLLAGYSYEENKYQSSGAQNRQFATDLFGYNNLGAGENLLNGDVWSTANMYKLISSFGRVNYSFLGRYIVTATLRRDGSSKFGPNNKWGTFPSVSAAWRIIDEPFMGGASFLSDIKLRAGYGVSGNQEGIDPYLSLQLYGISGQYFDSGNWYAAYQINQNANPDLRWEQTETYNIALEFATKGNRVSGTLEWYNKKTNDLLFTYDVPVPPYLYSNMLANVGSMSNKGVELTLSGDIIRKDELNWTLGLNLARNRNILTSLSNDLFSTSSIKYNNLTVRGSGNQTTHILEEGREVGTFFGWRNLGLDAEGKFIMDDMIDGKEGLTNDDWTYIGTAQPDFTYGISSALSYKNFDLSFFLRGVYGHDIINVTRMRYATTLWLPGTNVLRDALTNGLTDNPRYSSYYVEKGSFLRLDNATLAYNFNIHNFWGINRLRMYVSGQNLFVVTNYTGLDPETSMEGLNPGIEASDYYPKARTFSLGVNLSF